MKHPWIMQRFKLHLRGIKVPKLGSLQDRVLREVVLHENQLEAKKTEFLMLIAATNANFSDNSKHREWHDGIKSTWRDYIGMLMNVEIPKHSKSDETMLEYYDKVVKHLRPKISRSAKDKKLQVTGLDILKK